MLCGWKDGVPGGWHMPFAGGSVFLYAQMERSIICYVAVAVDRNGLTQEGGSGFVQGGQEVFVAGEDFTEVTVELA